MKALLDYFSSVKLAIVLLIIITLASILGTLVPQHRSAAEYTARYGQLAPLLVTLDIYKNETGSLAHYVLPSTSPFERPDLLFAFPLFMGMQSRPYLEATEPVLPPDGEQRDDARHQAEDEGVGEGAGPDHLVPEPL